MAGEALGYTDSVLEICSEVCEPGKIFTRRSWALFITLLSDTWETPLANRFQELQPWKCGGRCPDNPVRVDLAVDYIVPSIFTYQRPTRFLRLANRATGCTCSRIVGEIWLNSEPRYAALPRHDVG